MTVQSREWLSSAKILPPTRIPPGRSWKRPPPSISFCLPAALPFSNLGEMTAQVWCLVSSQEQREGIWTLWHGVTRPEPSYPAQLSHHWWSQDEKRVRRGRTEWSIPKGTVICLMSWVLLSPFFPQLFDLTAALPWVLVSLMGSRSSWAASLHQEGLSLCLCEGCIQVFPLSEAFVFGRNWLVFRTWIYTFVEEKRSNNTYSLAEFKELK